MPQQTSPFLETKYGWDYGESLWNGGADENWIKTGFMFDGNVDSITASLPTLANGQAHYLTTDSRFYFAVGGVWYSSPCPKWFVFKVRSSGDYYQFNGTSAVQVDSPSQVGGRLSAVEASIGSLGTAAYEDVANLATQAELDVAAAQANTYTDTSLATHVSDPNPHAQYLTESEANLLYSAYVKNNSASVDPVVTDDSSSGYAPFSKWINTVTQHAWMCIDASVGAAVWKQITNV